MKEKLSEIDEIIYAISGEVDRLRRELRMAQSDLRGALNQKHEYLKAQRR